MSSAHKQKIKGDEFMKNNFRKIIASFLTILITFLSSTASNVVSAIIVNLTVKQSTQE